MAGVATQHVRYNTYTGAIHCPYDTNDFTILRVLSA